MSFLRFRLPAALSRGAVVAAFCCTTTAITAYIYSTRVGGNPTRIYKDKDGAWRMMTRHDVMILRIEELEGLIIKDPEDKALEKQLQYWKAALLAESAKLKAEGRLPEEYTDDDLTLK